MKKYYFFIFVFLCCCSGESYKGLSEGVELYVSYSSSPTSSFITPVYLESLTFIDKSGKNHQIKTSADLYLDSSRNRFINGFRIPLLEYSKVRITFSVPELFSSRYNFNSNEMFLPLVVGGEDELIPYDKKIFNVIVDIGNKYFSSKNFYNLMFDMDKSFSKVSVQGGNYIRFAPSVTFKRTDFMPIKGYVDHRDNQADAQVKVGRLSPLSFNLDQWVLDGKEVAYSVERMKELDVVGAEVNVHLREGGIASGIIKISKSDVYRGYIANKDKRLTFSGSIDKKNGEHIFASGIDALGLKGGQCEYLNKIINSEDLLTGQRVILYVSENTFRCQIEPVKIVGEVVKVGEIIQIEAAQIDNFESNYLDDKNIKFNLNSEIYLSENDIVSISGYLIRGGNTNFSVIDIDKKSKQAVSVNIDFDRSRSAFLAYDADDENFMKIFFIDEVTDSFMSSKITGTEISAPAFFEAIYLGVGAKLNMTIDSFGEIIYKKELGKNEFLDLTSALLHSGERKFSALHVSGELKNGILYADLIHVNLQHPIHFTDLDVGPLDYFIDIHTLDEFDREGNSIAKQEIIIKATSHQIDDNNFLFPVSKLVGWLAKEPSLQSGVLSGPVSWIKRQHFRWSMWDGPGFMLKRYFTQIGGGTFLDPDSLDIKREEGKVEITPGRLWTDRWHVKPSFDFDELDLQADGHKNRVFDNRIFFDVPADVKTTKAFHGLPVEARSAKYIASINDGEHLIDLEAGSFLPWGYDHANGGWVRKSSEFNYFDKEKHHVEQLVDVKLNDFKNSWWSNFTGYGSAIVWGNDGSALNPLRQRLRINDMLHNKYPNRNISQDEVNQASALLAEQHKLGVLKKKDFETDEFYVLRLKAFMQDTVQSIQLSSEGNIVICKTDRGFLYLKLEDNYLIGGDKQTSVKDRINTTQFMEDFSYLYSNMDANEKKGVVWGGKYKNYISGSSSEKTYKSPTRGLYVSQLLEGSEAMPILTHMNVKGTYSQRVIDVNGEEKYILKESENVFGVWPLVSEEHEEKLVKRNGEVKKIVGMDEVDKLKVHVVLSKDPDSIAAAYQDYYKNPNGTAIVLVTNGLKTTYVYKGAENLKRVSARVNPPPVSWTLHGRVTNESTNAYEIINHLSESSIKTVKAIATSTPKQLASFASELPELLHSSLINNEIMGEDDISKLEFKNRLKPAEIVLSTPYVARKSGFFSSSYMKKFADAYYKKNKDPVLVQGFTGTTHYDSDGDIAPDYISYKKKWGLGTTVKNKYHYIYDPKNMTAPRHARNYIEASGNFFYDGVFRKMGR